MLNGKMTDEERQEYEEILRLCLRALTEGMADVPHWKRWSKCAQMRVEAKRAVSVLLAKIERVG